MDVNRALKNELLTSAGALKGNHLERLSTGTCTVIAGLLFMDIISAFARIGETAYVIIETRRNFADGRASGID
jgi:phosphate:Na+ symporter